VPVPLPSKVKVTGVAGASGWLGGVRRPSINPCVAQLEAIAAQATMAAIVRLDLVRAAVRTALSMPSL
jgi:hypothetical protein